MRPIATAVLVAMRRPRSPNALARYSSHPLTRCTRSRGSRRWLSTEKPPSPPPPSTGVEELSDREMVLRLLRRRPSSQRTWLWVGGVAFVGVTLVAFGPELKVGVSKHTADVATKSLQDETLQSHTRELASQIVQTVLNDPNVLHQASRFIQRLVVMDTTRDAVRALVVHVLNDPVTLQQVTALAKSLVTILLEDAKTRDQVVQLVRVVMQDPATRESVLKLLDTLMHDPTVQKNLAGLLAQTFGTEPVKHSVSTTIGESVHDVLSRQDIQNHAKQFVGSVVQDQTVQAQSGDAIWGTVMYAITPSWLSWIWEKGSEPTAETSVIVAATTTPEGQAVLAETEEAFIDAVEKRVENAENVAEEGEPEKTQQQEDQVEDQTPPPPPSRFEMLRRLTMRLPLVSSDSNKDGDDGDASAAEMALVPPSESSSPTPSQKKKNKFKETHADRHGFF